MTEMVISIVAIVLILGLARLGVHFGAFYEVICTVFLFLAMMIALRYWWLVTRLLSPWFNGQNGFAAFGAFWITFLVGAIPLIVLMSRVNREATPKYPRVVDASIGLIFGALSAVILVCTVMTSLSVGLPKVWSEYDRQKLLVPMDQAPIAIYQTIEKHWIGIGTNDTGRTRFPTFEKSDADDMQKFWH